MKSSLFILAQMIFCRPLVVILLLLLCAVGGFLFVVVDSSKSAVLFAIFFSLGGAGCAAILTERIARFSVDAGTLGLPDHARRMRQVQGWFLVLFAVLPALLEISRGLAIWVAVLTSIIAPAAGITFVRMGTWIVVVVFAAQLLPAKEMVANPWIQFGAAIFAVWALWQWFSLATSAEESSRLAPASFADAQHESPRERLWSMMGRRQSATSSSADGQSRNASNPGLISGRTFAQRLEMGLGYVSRTQWPLVAQGAASALLMMGAGGQLWGSTQKPYALATFFCCSTLFGRLQNLVSRWMTTPVEQSLLRLAPGWPPDSEVKSAVLATLLKMQAGAVVAWTLISIAALYLGWIDFSLFKIGALGVFSTCLAFSSSTLATLSRKRVPEVNILSIMVVLTVAMGAGLVLASSAHGIRWMRTGSLLMVLPFLAALMKFSRQPLRVPMENTQNR